MKKYDIYIPTVSYQYSDGDYEYYEDIRGAYAVRSGNYLGAKDLFLSYSKHRLGSVFGFFETEDWALEDRSIPTRLAYVYNDEEEDTYFNTETFSTTLSAEKGRHRTAPYSEVYIKNRDSYIKSHFGDSTVIKGTLYCITGAYYLDYDWDLDTSDRRYIKVYKVFKDEKSACDEIKRNADAYVDRLINDLNQNLGSVSSETLSILKETTQKWHFDIPYPVDRKRSLPTVSANYDGIELSIKIESIPILKQVEAVPEVHNEQ